jgi:hypothetical protein
MFVTKVVKVSVIKRNYNYYRNFQQERELHQAAREHHLLFDNLLGIKILVNGCRYLSYLSDV